jgi:4-hydroxy 2-oxovalerate aldolase
MMDFHGDETVILDCTLRDGGYYNQWDFDEALVNEYLDAVAQAGIKFVEIGFRFTPKDTFFGPYAYSTDDFLRSLVIPDVLNIGVMLNAKDLVSFDGDVTKCIDSLFVPASQSPVKFVRIATHLSEVDDCHEAICRLVELGYQVGLNLMQANLYSREVLSDFADNINAWGKVFVLYFADSLGNMNSVDVQRLVESFSKHWHGAIGIHAHNNMGRAINNTTTALETGVQWLDATILGMGRGAGNAASEILLLEMVARGEVKYSPQKLLEIIEMYFSPLKQIYAWGENFFYYMAGLHKVHPTYVQEMLSNDQYITTDVINVISSLDEETANSFSNTSLQSVIDVNYKNWKGSWDATDWVQNKTVLILAGGKQLFRHQPAILQYIERHNPIVLSLNLIAGFSTDVITFFVACHPTRIRAQALQYQALGKPLILPFDTLTEEERNVLKDNEIYDYGMSVENGALKTNDIGCTVPYPLAIAYALSVICQGGAKKIIFCGFDGYDSSDPRQSQTNEVLRHIEHDFPALPLIAATPSSYGLIQQSIYQVEI